MKTFLHIDFLLSIFMLILSSCNNGKDDSDENTRWIGQPDYDGLMYDGGELKGLSFFCMDASESPYDKKVKTLNDFLEIKFRVDCEFQDNKNRRNLEYPDHEAIAHQEWEYYRKKTSFILTEYYQNQDKILKRWVFFVNAYINGKATLTCDKTLYGEEPGSDLSKHFYIGGESWCMPVGIENTTLLYDFEDEMPTRMSEFFPMEAWLQPEYKIQPIEKPEEKYEDITFYITIPLKLEHVYEYVWDRYKNNGNAELQRTDTVFTSQCTVRFNIKE